MEDCLFCQIVGGKIPSEKIAEDAEFLAILGIMPKFPGMTVVLTREHKDSYLYDSLSDEELGRMHQFAKKVALTINQALGSFRTIQVMEGFEVPHAHLKLFPVYEGKKYDCSYEGKEQANRDELKIVAEKIRKAVS